MAFSRSCAAGFATDVTDLTLRGSDPEAKTPNTASYNLAIERQITQDIGATVTYVGNNSHHLQVFPDPNSPLALLNPNNSAQNTRPLPDFGGSSYTSYTEATATGTTHCRPKLEKRFRSGSSFLATYTWSHALDDAPTPLGVTGDGGYRQTRLLSEHDDLLELQASIRASALPSTDSMSCHSATEGGS